MARLGVAMPPSYPLHRRRNSFETFTFYQFNKSSRLYTTPFRDYSSDSLYNIHALGPANHCDWLED